ncbi:hypothetical protein [Duncaniella dubosii]|uniref:hypothetical protein n=1 Tax=Duncaniella dubosii TaxID=2518971 RepID=UPI000F519D2A|nr:hypothetical protein [Duncaniella dubosii]MCX4285413.1 hypothetical protein [Duncaniella dubosii]ROS83763.1 hypothetical protein EEK90_07080 [Muribaculaceae bacterium Isolate-036 (Harlan)]
MREIPNDILANLLRYLPMLIENLDQQKVRKSLRLTNAVRVLNFHIIPKLKKIDNEQKNRNREK